MNACFSIRRLCRVLLGIGCLSGRVQAGDFQLISTVAPAQGPVSGGGGDSWAPIISPDSRLILFASTANNLLLASNNATIPPSFPSVLNLYLRDLQSATIALVSVNLSGVAGGNGDSLPADLSTNGRYALFVSSASDLVSGDTNSATDVFVRDLVSGTTTLVSVNTNGVAGNGASRSPAMTLDGRYVAFVSDATDLVPGDTNKIADVFVRDLQAGMTMLASVGAVSTNRSSPTGNGSSESPALSADGRYVAFFSTATNLVQGVPPGGDVYVRDLAAGATTWASSYARTVLNTNKVVSFNLALSADGQFVAYEASKTSGVGTILRYSLASGLTDIVHTNGAVPITAYQDIQTLDMSPDGRFIAFVANTNDTSTSCILLWDANSGMVSLISGDTNNQVPAGATCDQPSLTPDGRFVAFVSTSSNLTSNPLIGDYHLYVRDTQAGATTMLDADTNGVGSLISPAVTLRITPDAHFAAFDCDDAYLVPNDRNRGSDVFLRDITSGAVQMISTHDPALPSATANGSSTIASTSMTTDGHFIAFASDADNLTSNDTNECSEVFVRDLASGATVLVSVNTNGWSGDAVSFDPAISPDGRFVAFTSSADDLISGATNKVQQVFLRDLQNGTTTLVSISSAGNAPGNKDSYSPFVSTGGRYVLFRSQALNLAAVSGSIAYPAENLFLRDMQAGVTHALTTQGQSGFVAMSADGHYVALGAPATGSACYLYLWNSQSEAFIYTNSFAGTLATSIYGAAITPDGSRAAFAGTPGLYLMDTTTGSGSLLAPASTNYEDLRFSANGLWLACAQRGRDFINQIYLYDLQNGGSTQVTHNLNPSSAPSADSDSPAISADGRFVAYRSRATNLVAGVATGLPEVFLYDRQTGLNSLLGASLLNGLNPNNRSLPPVFSGDGDTLAFASWASDLVSGDFNQNSDVFTYTFLNLTLAPAASPGQGPWLTWPWVSGNSYQVEFKDDLNAAAWQALGGTYTNLGTKAWLQDPAPPPSQRFYRVGTY